MRYLENELDNFEVVKKKIGFIPNLNLYLKYVVFKIKQSLSFAIWLDPLDNMLYLNSRVLYAVCDVFTSSS